MNDPKVSRKTGDSKFVCFSSTKDFSNAKTKIQATSEKGQSACHETIKNSEQLPFSGNNDLIEFGSCNDIGGNRCDTSSVSVNMLYVYALVQFSVKGAIKITILCCNYKGMRCNVAAVINTLLNS